MEQAISQIVSAKNDSDAIRVAVVKQQACSAAMRDLNPPLITAGYAGNWLSEIWVTSYVGLAILIAVHRAREKLPARWWRVISTTLVLYSVFDWSSYVRNFFLTSEADGRRVYSFVNWDVGHASFILQEFRSLGMMLLIAVLWDQYGQLLELTKKNIAALDSSRGADDELFHGVMLYRNSLQQWQTDSILWPQFRTVGLFLLARNSTVT